MASEKPKLSFSIGQVAQHTGLPQSVLRYWETVFKSLKPHKSPGGTRLYSQQDIQLILRIKSLLYENGFTIKGANIQLQKDRASAIKPDSSPVTVTQTPKKVAAHTSQNKKQKEAVISVGDLQVVLGKLKEMMNVLNS